MSESTSPPIPLPLRPLRISLVLGALVDAGGGLGLLLRPEATARWFGVPVEGHLDFWPTYAAVFLFVLPLFYIVTALNPTRMLPNVGVAIVGRFLGALAYALWYVPLNKPNALLGMIVLNLAFGMYTFTILKPWGRKQLYDSLRVSNQR